MKFPIEDYIPAIAELCRTYGVLKLEVFGSVCTGQFDSSRSDVDLIASFENTGPGYADRYLSFADAVEALLDRRVDVITPRSIGDGYFRRSVDQCRMVIYDQRHSHKAA